jgi:Rps23 Pro-64 3,4-dihydroxylase Tpa1-like proline 4-hydroxylase
MAVISLRVIDPFGSLKHLRILTCIYNFAATPRRFSGGSCASIASSSIRGGLVSHGDIMPKTDSLVVFPSWILHEVLPVEVLSGDWADGRFTINCRIHRVGARRVPQPWQPSILPHQGTIVLITRARLLIP